MRGSQPDRFVQGPGHGPRGREGGRSRGARDRLRIDGEHRGVCGGVRSTGRDRGDHRARGRRARELEARTGARGRRTPRRGGGHVRRRASRRRRSSPGARVPSSSTRRTRIGSKDRRPQRSRSSSSSAGRPTCSLCLTAEAATRWRTRRASWRRGSRRSSSFRSRRPTARRRAPLRSAFRLPSTAPRWTKRSLAPAAQSSPSPTTRSPSPGDRSRGEEGIFCEPASAAALAGVDLTGLAEGTRVVLVLTGHGLKDPDALDRLPGAS